jgi:hypothetical protein
MGKVRTLTLATVIRCACTPDGKPCTLQFVSYQHRRQAAETAKVQGWVRSHGRWFVKQHLPAHDRRLARERARGTRRRPIAQCRFCERWLTVSRDGTRVHAHKCRGVKRDDCPPLGENE